MLYIAVEFWDHSEIDVLGIAVTQMEDSYH